MAKFISKFTGEEIDRRLEDVDKKAGLFYYDSTNNRYLVFANESARDEYLEDPSKVELIIGTFDAPFNYTAKIVLESKAYNAVSLGSTGHFLDFTFDIENKNGQSTGENVICTYTFRRGSVKQTVVEQYAAGRSVHFNIDKYLSEGTNNITIAIQGVTSLAATTAAITYQVVNLQISTRYDISNVYNLSTDAKTMEIPFAVSGYGTKMVEWYVDGVLQPFVKDEDEVVDSSVERTKYITLNNLSQGRHSLQLRAYTVVNGESFYTDTLYRDFIVYTASNSNPIVAVAVTIPKEHGVLGVNDAVSIYNMVQYVPYTLEFATYSPSNASSLDTQILLDGEVKGNVQSVNGLVNTFSLVSKTSGNKSLTIKVGAIEYTIPTHVSATDMKLQEITNNLVLNFDALGRSNNETNRDKWSYGNYTGTLTGFNWNNTSGWVNNRLEMNAGSSFAIDIAPLLGKPTAEGKTIELEWSTKNVHDDNAVICDLRENGVGVCIYATKVSMTSADGVVIETEYKSDENVRIAFVINRAENATNKGLSFIYANGIVSRADNWAETDSYASNATIEFNASDDVEISLKAIRIYNAALANDQILNNYILYRDTIDEMTEVYNRNDVYAEGTSTFDPEKMMNRLPVMIVTGDIPTLENTSDKDTQITVDIEYINMQDTSLSFTMKNAAMRPQGTSSMGYPKKNFRIYTQKVYNTQLFDANGNEVADKLYAFKHGSQPVDCWCLKADYAESSGTHNTGIARLWNEALFNAQIQHENVLGEVTDGYALRTNAQQIALMSGYPYDVRTTIDGFPILLFYRPSINDDLIFIGKYNFNNDKSTESVFGFEGIPNFDNSKMQCWEILNNGNALALFNTMEGFDEKWSEAYESRYPDTKTPYLGDLKAFSEWMTSVTMERFATEKWAHLDIYKMAAYWCYLMRHAGADQFVKNAMFTSEDGQHFYFILYDNDTINGLINSGRLKIKPTDTRQTVNEAGDYVFAGHDSRLWNMLEADAEFNRIVSIVDNALYSSGISYQNTIRIFDNEQADKWVERVYNQDAQYKYIGPYVEKGVDNLFMLQGKRDLHRKWWLSKRFAIYDAKYVSGTYKSQAIEIKCENAPVGQQFTITSGYPLSYGYGINTLPREYGIELAVGESYTFATREVVNIGDPIRIYGAPNIAGLDLSKMVDTIREITIAQVYDEAQGTKLTKLIVGGKPNYSVTGISGLGVATALEYIDVSGLLNMVNLDLNNHQYIKTVKAKGSGIASITFAKGAPVELLELPAAIRILTLEQLPYLTTDGLDFEDLSSVQGFSIKSCPNLSNDYALIKEWMSVKTTEDSRCSIVMDNVNWEGVSGAEMVRIAQLGTASLKGKIVLTDITEAQGNILTSVFGDTIYDPNAELFVDAPNTLTIFGETSLLEGQDTTFTWSVYPRLNGSIAFSLNSYRAGCSITKDGVLTTDETGDNTSTLQVKAVFTSTDGEVLTAYHNVLVSKRSYPTDATLSGATNPVDGFEYTITYPTVYTGEYVVEWLLQGYITEYIEFENKSKDGCTLKMLYPPMTQQNGALTATFKKVYNNEVFLVLNKPLSLYIEGVVITKATNEAIQEVLYNSGLVANETYSLRHEIESITANDIQTGTDAESSVFYQGRDTITTFDEFELFTGLTIVPAYCFAYLAKMTRIKLPATITSVAANAFLNCESLTNVQMQEGLLTLGDYTFQNCVKLSVVELPSTVISLGRGMFEGCRALSSVNIPQGVTTISYRCFARTGLKTFVIPDHVTNLDSDSFTNCESLESVTFSNQLKTIPTNAFVGCLKLDNVVLPEGIRHLSTNSFFNCKGLTNIELPSTLASIGDGVFDSCLALSSITSKNTTAPSVTSGTFGVDNSTYTGRNNYSKGTNKLHIPQNATGYEDSYWGSVLLDSSKCGYNIYGKLTINSNKSDATFNVTYQSVYGGTKTIEVGAGITYIPDVEYGTEITIVPFVISNHIWDWASKKFTYNENLVIENNSYIYPQNATIEGVPNPCENPTYTWSTTTDGVDGDYAIEWLISDSLKPYMNIASQDNLQCVMNVTEEPINVVNGTLTLVLRKSYDGSILFTSTKTIALQKIIRPTALSISGDSTIYHKGDTHIYTLNVTPSNINVTYSTSWKIAGSSNVAIINSNNSSCTIEVLNETTSALSFTLTATVTTTDGLTTVTGSKTITLAKVIRPTKLKFTSGDSEVRFVGRYTYVVQPDINPVNVSLSYSTPSLTGDAVTQGKVSLVSSNNGTIVISVTSESTSDLAFTINQNATVSDGGEIVSGSKTVTLKSVIRPTGVTISGASSINGGESEVYTASATPANTNVDVTYTWSVSGSSNVSIQSTDGAKCTLKTNAVEEDESFTLNCTINDGKNSYSTTKSGTVKPKPNYITATYNITSTSSATKLFGIAANSFSYMEIDGVEVTPVNSYKFSTTGEHTVRFTVNKLSYLFEEVKNLTAVSFSECNGAIYNSFDHIFYACSALTLINYGSCRFPNITKLSFAFEKCSSLTSIDLTPLSGAPITDLHRAFFSCTKLASIDLTPLTGAPIITFRSTFYGCSSLTSIDLTPLSGAPITDLSSTFEGCSNLTSIDLTPFTGAPITSLSTTFEGCSNLTSIDLTPLSGAPITDLYSTFAQCSKLASIDLRPLSGAPITDLGFTFSGCSSLTSIDLTPLSGAPITRLENIFYGCRSLTSIDLPPFVGAPITSLQSTFNGCSSLTSIDLTPLSGAPITSLYSTFYSCYRLSKLDWGDCVFPNVNNMHETFYGCSSLTSIDLTPLSGAQITTLERTFYNCSSLNSIDLTPFTGAPITSLSTTFYNCKSLTSINLTPLTGAPITNFSSTFASCLNLRTIIADWDSAPVISSSTFGSNTSTYTGRNTYNNGVNTLYVPTGATGYDSSYWLDPLCNATKCGFTLSKTL